MLVNVRIAVQLLQTMTKLLNVNVALVGTTVYARGSVKVNTPNSKILQTIGGSAVYA